MDSLELVAFARTLIDIDSTTGIEPAAGGGLRVSSRSRGYEVEEQPVADGRFNLSSRTLGVPPAVVLSTHYDCVPPFIPSSVRDGRLYGRGACDAKGILAAQIAAAERLRASGERRVALLFVVGEERGSDGAAAANLTPPGSAFLINGEPTDNRLATSTRGVLRVRLERVGQGGAFCGPRSGRVGD